MTQKKHLQKKQKQIAPLRQSACMILFQDLQSPQKMLMFQRNAKITFGNAVVFPGGACDSQDKEFTKSIINIQGFENYSKISAIRQLFQETGILLVPSKDHPIVKQVTQKKQKMKEFSHKFFCHLWKDNLNLIVPLIRLLTAQIVPGKRFDTIFYTPHPNVYRINMGNVQKGENHQSLSTLRMSSEGETYFWLSAEELLEKYCKNEISLVHAQVIILKSLKSVKSYDQLLNLNPQKCYEPIMMDTKNMKFFIMFGDHEYVAQNILMKEPQSESKNNFQKYVTENRQYFYEEGKPKMRRFQIDLKEKSFVFKSHFIEHSLIGYLVSNPEM